jgi:hypothetical protein
MNIPKILALLIALGLRVALADSDQVLENLDAQRVAIESQRSDVVRTFDAKERACYSDFAVSTCLRKVATERRTVLYELKQKDLALARLERIERAAQQRVRLEEKASERLEFERKLDPNAIESNQADKRNSQSTKVQDHASTAKIPTARASAPKDSNAPTPEQRLSNQAAYDKKILDAKKRIDDRQKRLDQPPAAPSPPLPVNPKVH